MAEKLQKTTLSKGRFDEFIEHALIFLESPWKLWDRGNFTQKQTVLKLAFAECPTYHRETGYRTPKTTLPFKVLAGIYGGKCKMVHLEGETSNTLFEVLEDWENQLKHADFSKLNVEFEEPQP